MAAAVLTEGSDSVVHELPSCDYTTPVCLELTCAAVLLISLAAVSWCLKVMDQ